MKKNRVKLVLTRKCTILWMEIYQFAIKQLCQEQWQRRCLLTIYTLCFYDISCFVWMQVTREKNLRTASEKLPSQLLACPLSLLCELWISLQFLPYRQSYCLKWITSISWSKQPQAPWSDQSRTFPEFNFTEDLMLTFLADWESEHVVMLRARHLESVQIKLWTALSNETCILILDWRT